MISANEFGKLRQNDKVFATPEPGVLVLVELCGSRGAGEIYGGIEDVLTTTEGSSFGIYSSMCVTPNVIVSTVKAQQERLVLWLEQSGRYQTLAFVAFPKKAELPAKGRIVAIHRPNDHLGHDIGREVLVHEHQILKIC